MKTNASTFRTPGSIFTLSLFVLLATGCQAPVAKKITVTYYYTQTDDGIALALRRYQPLQLNPEKDPVILCHGLAYNMLFWDLDDKVSLPRYLADNGYDVWSLSLRGACPSSQPLSSSLRRMAHFNLETEMLSTLKDRLADVKMSDWSVDDHIKHDLPAAIHFVCEQTNHPRLHWIGHSMGGMAMFAYLTQASPDDAARVKTFVAAAVPMTVFHPLSDPFRLLVDTEVAIDVGSRILGSSAPAAFGTIFGDLNTPTDKLFYHGDNVDEIILRTLFRLAQEEISSSQLKQLLGMVRTEHFTSLDGAIDYTDGLTRVTTPTCFLVGTVDNLATIGAVQYAFRQIASQQKDYHLFGRVNSQANDYGHNDIIIGRNARSEVYPTILQWLNKFPSLPDEVKMLLQPLPLPTAPATNGNHKTNGNGKTNGNNHP